MQQIAETFVDLCTQKPLEKVSISDIVSSTGNNRKTFYYHFENKENLVAWVYRSDMGKMLVERFPESMLVYEKTGKGPSNTAQFPFYMRNKSGIRSLNQGQFFECFGAVLETRRTFYAQALNDSGRYGLRNYLHELYTEALKGDVRLILSNRPMSEKDIDFLASINTGAFLDYLCRLCQQTPEVPLTGTTDLFSNYIHESMEQQIKSAQAHRSL